MLNFQLEQELDVREDKKYKLEVIKNSAIYNKVEESKLLALYHLVFWKSYSEYGSTWKPLSAVIQL